MATDSRGYYRGMYAVLMVFFMCCPAFAEWYKIEPLRQVSPQLGKVLGDVESRMPAGHQYRDSDRITWTHETTHGLNSRLRQRFHKPSFYVLNGYVCVLEQHPAVKLSDVARYVPSSLRSTGYNLYLQQQQQYWNNEPLYIFDELTAYSNGAAAIIDLRPGGDRYYGADLAKVIEFMNYGLVLTQIGHDKLPTEAQRTQFKAFVKWQVERSMMLYLSGRRAGFIDTNPADTLIRRLRESPDAASLRKFSRSYFGEKWCKDILGLNNDITIRTG